ncbi:MAG: transketolase family protein [Exilispira sp.]|jgi:transketolase|nr:transketolase family protein [Exilispira sp.]
MAEKEMRQVYTETLIELAEKDPNIVVLEADLMKSTGTASFAKKFPERFFDVGVAEANMVGIASGLSAVGKIPFAATFACFATRRAHDQFFISANYAKLNVKLIGADPGVTAAFNGGTHMPFEDIALTRVIPDLIVFEPSDPVSLKKLLIKSAYHKGCTYMRLHRKATNTIYNETEEFEFGKGKILTKGNDAVVFALGVVCVNEALKAAQILSNEGINITVVDMISVKPIDKELIISLAQNSKVTLTFENHQVINGLGSAVCEVLSENYPKKIIRLGVQDLFGEVGTLDYLKNRYGITAENLIKNIKNALEK